MGRSGANPIASGLQLGSTPAACVSNAGLTVALATIPGSWWVLDPNDWPHPPGSRLQFRVRAIAQGAAAGDVLGVQPFNVTDGTGLLPAVATGAFDANAAKAVSPWQDFPAAKKVGYIQAANQTFSRGTFLHAVFDVRAI